METTNSQIVQDLITARDSLTPETWIKRAYFKQKETNICMCAHGAVQRVVNPACKEAVSADGAAAGGAASSGAGAIKLYKDPLKAWNARHDWIRQDRIYNGVNYGKRDLHYLLGMVGLTTAFNDDPNTTLEMVKAKFNEAIELAKQLKI
jgi:hypothetical protein